MEVKRSRGRPKNEKPSHSVFVRVDADLFSMIQKKCTQRECTMSALILDALKKYFGL